MGRKRLNKSPVGIRFEQALISRFGTIEAAMQHYQLARSSVNAYISGYTQLGLKWKLRLEKDGISYELITTGKGSMDYKPPVDNQQAEYVTMLENKLIAAMQTINDLQEENKALRGSLAPHLVQTVLAGVSKSVSKKK
jgi:hypothetical protein